MAASRLGDLQFVQRRRTLCCFRQSDRWATGWIRDISILEQLREEAPGDLVAERALWARLAERLLDLEAPLAVQ